MRLATISVAEDVGKAWDRNCVILVFSFPTGSESFEMVLELTLLINIENIVSLSD